MKQEREFHGLFFGLCGLFCFHVAFIHIKTGDNWRITNGRGARPLNIYIYIWQENILWKLNAIILTDISSPF